MQSSTTAVARFIGAISAIILAHAALGADADDQPASAAASATNSSGTTDTRYGLFNGLDHRSAYTKDVFPEPFIVDDMALEDNEIELTWGHSEGRGRQNDIGTLEFQKGFGLLTLEAQIPIQRIDTPDRSTKGLGLLELGARYPLYQYVSANQMVDATFGVGLQTGIPLQLRVDRNAELEPQTFCCLKLGDHFTMQTVLGYDVLLGDGDNGGERSYDLGASLAYAIPHRQLPLPGVQDFFPMLELDDDMGLNKDEKGLHDFQGDVGFRARLNPIGELQPSFGAAYVFPLDTTARHELHWGIMVSMIFDF